jgi:hypothetical protein
MYAHIQAAESHVIRAADRFQATKISRKDSKTELTEDTDIKERTEPVSTDLKKGSLEIYDNPDDIDNMDTDKRLNGGGPSYDKSVHMHVTVVNPYIGILLHFKFLLQRIFLIYLSFMVYSSHFMPFIISKSNYSFIYIVILDDPCAGHSSAFMITLSVDAQVHVFV